MAYAGQDGGGDVEMCKAFLMEKNNNKELNIDKLCLVGAEMGAVVAVDWAARDWSWPILPGRKQGQDVKALVLLSPEWSFKGMTIGPAINKRDFVAPTILDDRRRRSRFERPDRSQTAAADARTDVARIADRRRAGRNSSFVNIRLAWKGPSFWAN